MLLDEKAYIAELERQNTEMLYAFDAMRQRAEAAQATGRAAVRALAQVLACWSSAAQEPAGVVCDSCVSVADVVLATDTAKAWLKEGKDGNG